MRSCFEAYLIPAIAAVTGLLICNVASAVGGLQAETCTNVADCSHAPLDDRLWATRILHDSLSDNTQRRYSKLAVAAIFDPNENVPFRDSILASATFLSSDWLLTASHPFRSTRHLALLMARVGYVLPSNPTNQGSVAPLLACDYVFDPSALVSSVRGHLDYLLIKMVKRSCNAGAGVEAEPVIPRPLPVAEKLVDQPVAVLGYTRNSQLPKGLTLLHGGNFLAARRYTKSLGTLVTLDYEAFSVPGFSGGPVFDVSGNWIAVHQRNLWDASEDEKTRWHPYLDEFYSYEKNNNGVWERPAWPRQATPLIDIAHDVVNKCGIRWMCANVPMLAAILPQRDEYACKVLHPPPNSAVSSKSLECGTEESRYRPPDVGGGDIN